MGDPGQPLPFEGLTPLQRENLRQERDVDIQERHTIVLIQSDVSSLTRTYLQYDCIIDARWE